MSGTRPAVLKTHGEHRVVRPGSHDGVLIVGMRDTFFCGDEASPQNAARRPRDKGCPKSSPVANATATNTGVCLSSSNTFGSSS